MSVGVGREIWLERVRASMEGFCATLAESTEGGSVIRREGLFASLIPAAPKRSVFNSVIYADGDAIVDALDELAERYAAAGILAWTVWVPEADRSTAERLAEAGHLLDAAPRAMGLELERAERADLGELDWFRDCDLITVGRVNDLAYGYSDRTFENALAHLPAERAHSYGVRVDGEIAAVLVADDFNEDTEIAWVATTEAARGRGLATALMRQSLWDARERGQRTATLQATKLGTPVYARLGFDDFGALEMWERRCEEAR
ncbi:MAG: GNAT family N-acetyltransferase [Solirubrobacterales bacterium]